MYTKRLLNISALMAKKSHFLFGARGTGKSSLIRHELEGLGSVYINLLRTELYLRLLEKPQELEGIILGSNKAPEMIVIDEIQLIPMLLNEVHRLIEEKRWRFLLTGSSARSLKQPHINLLGGRARQAELFPFIYRETADDNLMRLLRYGGLPAVYLSDEPEEELIAYVNTYLREEIQAEGAVRKLPSFVRFLSLAGKVSGEIVNFSAVSSDTGTPLSTVREYFHILEDTLVGFLVAGWQATKKRKALSTAKFYLFDMGIKHCLTGLKSLDPKSKDFGDAFEHFIALELRAYISYQRTHQSLCYWRTTHGSEVDFIVGDTLAVEVKSTDHVTEKHLKGLKALREEGLLKHYVLVSQDPTAQVRDHIMCLPWQAFLERLWQREFITKA
jgi:predicted AAA+ superfamily ATPase